VEARPRIDRDSRREAILDVAAEVFMDVGYSAASMSAIAARVGGSKGTLYNYFRSKEELFSAYIERYCARHQELMDEIVSQGSDARTVLAGLGGAQLRIVTSEAGLRNFSLIVSEAGRAPEIGRAFYRSGPTRGIARLAHFIERAIADGQLRPCDPDAAAHQFVGLCQHRLFKACLCNSGPDLTDAEMDAEVEAAVDTFMAAFGRPETRPQDRRSSSPVIPT